MSLGPFGNGPLNLNKHYVLGILPGFENMII